MGLLEKCEYLRIFKLIFSTFARTKVQCKEFHEHEQRKDRTNTCRVSNSVRKNIQ